jgi:Domain of Unknown Function (DUF1080)
MRPFKSTLLASIALAALAFAGCATKGQRTVNLFNGKNLDGWIEHSGKAKYTIEDGVLIGTSVAGTGNSFLCTTQIFGDFELELEFKCDDLLNSGVQIRSEVFSDARTLHIDGKDIKLTADRVHGYQVEIDMDAARGRMWSGGIYDEARRGWLFPADGEKGKQGMTFSEQGRKVSKPGEWNKLRIVAVGPSIKTWLNGEPRAQITDGLTPRGLIALQVHGVGNDAAKTGLKVCFRNIRIKPIANTASAEPAPNTLTGQEIQDGWRLLWDGKTTEGWRSAKAKTFPAQGWAIHDGVLTVHENKGEESAAGGDIITREKYSNFELKVDFKITPGANSGIKYFVHPNLDPITGNGAKASVGSAIGYEYQVLDDLLHPDAQLGRNGNRTLGSLYDLLPAAVTKKPNPVGEWNTALIIVRGNHVEHWLNGEKVLQYDRTSPEFRDAFEHSKFKNITEFPHWTDGGILLQEHGNEVSYRNVKIRVLTEK